MPERKNKEQSSDTQPANKVDTLDSVIKVEKLVNSMVTVIDSAMNKLPKNK